jgi:hypothetical protein
MLNKIKEQMDELGINVGDIIEMILLAPIFVFVFGLLVLMILACFEEAIAKTGFIGSIIVIGIIGLIGLIALTYYINKDDTNY